MVIAAIVIVIISRGIPSKPMIPRIKNAARKFGTGLGATAGGIFQGVEDLSGRGEIRKLGAEGGSIKFGGVELSGNYDTQKKLLNIYISLCFHIQTKLIV